MSNQKEEIVYLAIEDGVVTDIRSTTHTGVKFKVVEMYFDGVRADNAELQKKWDQLVPSTVPVDDETQLTSADQQEVPDFGPGVYPRESMEYQVLNNLEQEPWTDLLDKLAANGLTCEYDHVRDVFEIC